VNESIDLLLVYVCYDILHGHFTTQHNPYAIAAIGWYAKSHERDLQKAADHFTRAYRAGNPDAAYNLGVMHLHGELPGQQKDTVYSINPKPAK